MTPPQGRAILNGSPFARSGVTTNTFRAVNDRIRALDTFEDSDLAFFVCECDDLQCFRTLPLTADEYDELRAAGRSIYAEGCPARPWEGDRPAGVDLATVLRQRVAVAVRVEGLPVEGAPAG